MLSYIKTKGHVSLGKIYIKHIYLQNKYVLTIVAGLAGLFSCEATVLTIDPLHYILLNTSHPAC